MPRGGRRSGKPNTAYRQRTDLNQRNVPKQAATGQAYGKAGEQLAAQDALPVRPPPVAVAGSPPSPTAAGGPPLSPFNRPTDRPDEPITAGMSVGPGMGPDALALTQQQNADFADFASYLPALELMANQPTASVALRNFVRQVRGSLPIER